ncbi:hypothetical protein B9Z52_11370 [Limnohabitans sp. Jir72]|nr:hypothetical protein B9Z52_11370 [Limnohabitans sp. Jir72]
MQKAPQRPQIFIEHFQLVAQLSRAHGQFLSREFVAYIPVFVKMEEFRFAVGVAFHIQIARGGPRMVMRDTRPFDNHLLHIVSHDSTLLLLHMIIPHVGDKYCHC